MNLDPPLSPHPPNEMADGAAVIAIARAPVARRTRRYERYAATDGKVRGAKPNHEIHSATVARALFL
jgi:hypothetical protein